VAQLMALDFGQKRTGIAITDPLKLIASGLETVQTSDLMPFLEQYFSANEVEGLVIGEPKRMDNSASAVESDIQKFIEKVRNRFPSLPIWRQDERFTSKIAVQAMVEGGMKKKKRQDKGMVDQISATLILQAYLSRKA
jgi:putative Holliday junction resolvase